MASASTRSATGRSQDLRPSGAQVGHGMVGAEDTVHDPLSSGQLEAYLTRVGLTRVPRPDVGGLHDLHRAQFFSIPFENLDIRLGRGVDLSPDTVFDKLVMRRRGGYCFELNGLMLRVLRTVGFEARALLARVHLNDPPSGRTHQVNLVQLGGQLWAVDVGFGGGGPRRPLRLCEGVTATDAASYELAIERPWGWLLRTLEAGAWKASYSFDLGHVTAADIEVANHYTATSPRTHFTRECVVSLPTPDGRISLRDDVLTEVDGAGARTRTVEPGHYLEVLRETFGIDLPTQPPLR
jgi:N-hydroxyarylamine O-acetyltransferase